MKCNPLRWLLGILPLLLLAGVAVVSERARIEKDLAERTQQMLNAAGLGWASATFEGRDGVLSGMAPEEAETGRATDSVARTFGVRIVRNDARLIDTVERYDWAATKREGRVRLSGLVPNEKTRREIIGIARATYPSNEIVDRLTLARGAPALDIWLGGVGFALKQLALLKTGTIRLEGTELTVTGEAADAGTYRTLKSALASGLPPGISLKADRVEPPVVMPYVFTARLADGQLDLRGAVPGDQAREELLAAVRQQSAQVRATDGMMAARGEPDGWMAAAQVVLRELLRLDEGAAELRDQTITLSGVAARETTADDVRAKLKEDIPAAYRLADRITFREPAIKTVSPYRTSMAFEDGAITLTGFVPSEAARTALAGQIQTHLSGVRLVDQLELGAGASPGWLKCLETGITALSRLGNGRLDLTNRRLLVEGVSVSEAVARALPGEVQAAAGRDCDTEVRAVLKAPQEPSLRWSAQVGAQGDVVLEGQVPGVGVRDQLMSVAARLFDGRNVVDRMQVVDATSERWVRTALAGLAQLVRLRSGRAEIADQTLRLEGEVRDVAAQAAIRDALRRDVGEGYSVRDMVAVRSDAVIAAEELARRSAEETAKKRAAAETEAKRRAEEEARQRAEDEARRAADAAQARARAEAEAKQRAEDEARRSAAEEARRAAETAARERAEADTKISEEQARKNAAAEACQKALRTVSGEGVILFDRASAELDRRSLPTLRRLAQAANACPDVTIEIEGHTDSEGSDDRNQPLSERRAQSVADFLALRGVPMERMKAVGYGSSRPVATNETQKGMSRNRRIEFTVKPK
jgi:outer membrane protein OmpA-like peptidoglycan-associated protein/osmotically-inducible protein OsmY